MYLLLKWGDNITPNLLRTTPPHFAKNYNFTQCNIITATVLPIDISALKPFLGSGMFVKK